MKVNRLRLVFGLCDARVGPSLEFRVPVLTGREKVSCSLSIVEVIDLEGASPSFFDSQAPIPISSIVHRHSCRKVPHLVSLVEEVKDHPTDKR